MFVLLCLKTMDENWVGHLTMAEVVSCDFFTNEKDAITAFNKQIEDKQNYYDEEVTDETFIEGPCDGNIIRNVLFQEPHWEEHLQYIVIKKN